MRIVGIYINGETAYFECQRGEGSKYRYQLPTEAMSEEYLREYGQWKAWSMYSQARGPLPKRNMLKVVIGSLVNGYLVHGDIWGALEMLQSSSFLEQCPSADTVRMLLRRGFIGGSTGRFGSQEQRILCYLLEATQEGRLDPILGEFLKDNFLLDPSTGYGEQREGLVSEPDDWYDPSLPPALVLPNSDHSLFWMILEALLDMDELCRCSSKRDGVLELLNAIFARMFIIDRDAAMVFIKGGLTDKRLRRKFVTTHLMDLYKIMAGTPGSSLVPSLVAKMALTLDPADRLYESFLDEIYGQFHGLTQEEIVRFLGELLDSGRAPLPTAEFCLMLGERRFCLGSSKDRSCDLLGRTKTFCSQLRGLRVEGRNIATGNNNDDVEANDKMLIFHVLQLLILALIRLCEATVGGGGSALPHCLCPSKLADIRGYLLKVQEDISQNSKSYRMLENCIDALETSM